MADEQARDRARMELEDAVARAMEAGFTAGQVRSEVEYAIESIEDEDA